MLPLKAGSNRGLTTAGKPLVAIGELQCFLSAPKMTGQTNKPYFDPCSKMHVFFMSISS